MPLYTWRRLPAASHNLYIADHYQFGGKYYEWSGRFSQLVFLSYDRTHLQKGDVATDQGGDHYFCAAVLKVMIQGACSHCPEYHYPKIYCKPPCHDGEVVLLPE